MTNQASDLVIVLAEYEVTKDASWKAFVSSARLSEPLPSGVTKIFCTSWIVDTIQSPTFLGDLASASQEHGVPLQAFRVFRESPFLKQNCSSE